MSTVVRPVGPESQQTYWLRRIVMSIAAIVVVGLTIGFFRVVIAGGDQDEPSQSGSQAPVGPCSGGSLELIVAAAVEPGAAAAFPAEETVAFIAKVRNSGTTACSVDVGGDAMELKVVSGSDRIYSSTDCPATLGDSKLVVLRPGAEENTSWTWGGQRSAEGCPGDLPTPRPGTYKVTIAASGATSDPATFRLL